MEREKLYEALAEHFDQFVIGNPSTPSLMEILRIVFPVEEAEVALKMPLMRPITPSQLAASAVWQADRLESILERMAERGTVQKNQVPGEEARYTLLPSEKGWCETAYCSGEETEYNRKLAPLWLRYRDEGYGRELARGDLPVMRVIPVSKSLEGVPEVLPFEVLKAKLEEQSLIAVAHCACKRIKRTVGRGCDHSVEVCFSFESMAEYLLDYGLGRRVSLDETLTILERCEEEGLVHSVENYDGKIGTVCNCCSCCCVFLDSRKRLGFNTIAPSSYLSEVNAEACSACGKCQEICPMEAVRLDDGNTAVVDASLCMGCGLCASTCLDEAISLLPREEIKPPPAVTELVMRRMKPARRGGFRSAASEC